jgi:hypothetical protein
METKIVRVGIQTINMVLNSRSATLDETVVMGYAAKAIQLLLFSKCTVPMQIILLQTKHYKGTVAGISISPSNNYANTTIRGILQFLTMSRYMS